MYRLFLDDERFPIEHDWVIARDYHEAVRIVSDNGCPSFISFDHDLGIGKSGKDFANWFVEWVMDTKCSLEDFGFYVHSQNPRGKANIEGLMNNFIANWHVNEGI